MPYVESAVIDVAGTLDHVAIDGIPLWKLIARKAARLFGKADDIGATLQGRRRFSKVCGRSRKPASGRA